MLTIKPHPRNLHRDVSDAYVVETEAGDKLDVWFWKKPLTTGGHMSIVPDMTTPRGNPRGGMAFVFDEKETQQFITFLTENSSSKKRQLT